MGEGMGVEGRKWGGRSGKGREGAEACGGRGRAAGRGGPERERERKRKRERERRFDQ